MTGKNNSNTLSTVSARAEIYLNEPEFMLNCMTRCGKDVFDKETNREGIVNMGTAINSLCEDVIKQRFEKVKFSCRT